MHARTVAIKAARAGAEVLTHYFRNLQQLTVKTKDGSRRSIVTEADTQSEKRIVAVIRRHFPQHGFYAEEQEPRTGGKFTWVIDPLDGSLSFVRGLPNFCVSVGLAQGKVPKLGVVYHPLSGDCYVAEHGGGAFLNKKRIVVSKVKKLSESVVAHNWGQRDDVIDRSLEQVRRLAHKVRAVRVECDSTALDLCHVAAGRLDGYISSYCEPWDIFAGTVIVQEAGGFCSDLVGDQVTLATKNIIAANPAIYRKLKEKLTGK